MEHQKGSMPAKYTVESLIELNAFHNSNFYMPQAEAHIINAAIDWAQQQTDAEIQILLNNREREFVVRMESDDEEALGRLVLTLSSAIYTQGVKQTTKFLEGVRVWSKEAELPDSEDKESLSGWQPNDLGVHKGIRLTNTSIFIVREVGETTLQISYSIEFPGTDAGDGFLRETEEVKIEDVEPVGKKSTV